MRKQEAIYKEMEKLASSKYARFNTVKVGTLAWALGMADSIPKGIKLAHEALSKSNVDQPGDEAR